MHFVVGILCLLCVQFASADIVPAHRCDNRTFNGLNVTLRQLVGKRTWNVTHVTDNPKLNNIDHMNIRFSPDYSDRAMMYVRVVMTNSSTSYEMCQLRATGYGYFVNRCTDGKGGFVSIRYYVLYFKEDTFLYAYRCFESKGSRLDEDVRFVAVLGQAKMTDEDKQNVIELDKSMFSGPLHEFPWKLP